MKIVKKNKIAILVLGIVLVGLAIVVGNLNNKELTIDINNQYTETEQMIVSLNSGLKNFLKLDDEQRYNIIGTKEGESLFAFNDISYMQVVNGISKSSSKEVAQKELYFRGFFNVRNNLAFFKNEEFLKLETFFLDDNFIFTELEENNVINFIPELQGKISDWLTQDYIKFSYYKVNKNINTTIEMVYVIGTKSDETLQVVDVYYFIDGEYKKFIGTINFLNEIEDLSLNQFDYNKQEIEINKDKGNLAGLVERRENYQGSQPYVEQNFEKNDEIFKKESHK